MHSNSPSERVTYTGAVPHPFIKRALDNQDPGLLLLAGETATQHALYAAESGWEVHLLAFSEAERQQAQALAHEKELSLHSSLYNGQQPVAQGDQFDAVILLFTHQPPAKRQAFHQQVIRSLKPSGGNLYLLAYSDSQLAGSTAPLPAILYNDADLMKDFEALQIDLIQEIDEELAQAQKVRLIHLSAIRNELHDDKDSVSFKL